MVLGCHPGSACPSGRYPKVSIRGTWCLGQTSKGALWILGDYDYPLSLENWGAASIGMVPLIETFRYIEFLLYSKFNICFTSKLVSGRKSDWLKNESSLAVPLPPSGKVFQFGTGGGSDGRAGGGPPSSS